MKMVPFLNKLLLWASIFFTVTILPSLAMPVTKGGMVVVEAEDFVTEAESEFRRWYRISDKKDPGIKPDMDSNHSRTASGKAYVEVLPDYHRSTVGLPDNSVSIEPGKIAVIGYKVRFTRSGRYYCWVRGYSNGGDDDSLHLGLNGTWPSSGTAMSVRTNIGWHWSSSKMNTNQAPYLDIPSAGVHEVQFSMREDGAELDQFVLCQSQTTKEQLAQVFQQDKAYLAHHRYQNEETFEQAIQKALQRPSGLPSKIGANAQLEYVKPVISAKRQVQVGPQVVDFSARDKDGSYTIHSFEFPRSEHHVLERARFLLLKPEHVDRGETSVRFPYPSRRYEIELVSAMETAGPVQQDVLVDGDLVLSSIVPVALSHDREHRMKTKTPVRIRRGATLTIRTTLHANRKTSGRWEMIRLTPVKRR